MAKILIVEDEVSYCESLNTIFTHAGHQVRIANGSRDGLAQAKLFVPDIVISDWMLNNHFHGGELSERIRLSHPGTRFIVITGFLEVVELVEKLYDFIDEVVLKPFRTTEILAAVDRAIVRLRESGQKDSE